MEKNDWQGAKGRRWAKIFGSSFLRYIVGLYLFSNKHRKHVKKILKKKLQKGGHIVDMGAGSGYYSILAARLNSDVTVSSVDMSDMMLHELQNKIESNNLQNRVKIFKEDVQKTTISPNCAEIVMASNLLHELKTPDIFFTEAHRILKKDGILIVTEFIDNEFGRKVLSHHHDEVHGPYTVEELRNYLSEKKFQRIDVLYHKNRLLAIAEK